MKKGFRFPAMAILLCFCLTGCGTKLYDMTEDERNLITAYAGYVVSMHNTYQKDGIVSTTIIQPEAETTEKESGASPDTETKESGTEKKDAQQKTDAAPGQGETQQTEPQAGPVEVTLAEAVGHGSDLTITFKGCELKNSYSKGAGYSVNAPKGKTYIVAKFAIKNNTDKKVDLDNLSLGPRFRCGYEGSEAQVSAEVTFLEDDFGTYADSIKAGKTKDAVLLFAIPDNIKSIKGFTLSIVTNDQESKIKL